MTGLVNASGQYISRPGGLRQFKTSPVKACRMSGKGGFHDQNHIAGLLLVMPYMHGDEEARKS
jgi:hypothetical protein